MLYIMELTNFDQPVKQRERPPSFSRSQVPHCDSYLFWLDKADTIIEYSSYVDVS